MENREEAHCGVNTLMRISNILTEEMYMAENYYVSVSDPITHELPIDRPRPALANTYATIRTLRVQAFLFLNFVAAFIVLFVQYYSAKGTGSWYTAFSMLIYVIEISLMTIYYASSKAYFDQLWLVLDPAVVWFGLVLEMCTWCTSTRKPLFVVLTMARICVYAIHAYSRFLQLRFAIRCRCSADRRRYQSEGFDLDLAYITRNMSAMAWPATNFETLFRNGMGDVVRFFETKHPGSHRIVNLCSERSYTTTPNFSDARTYAMDDHNPGELSLLLEFCRDSHSYIQQEPSSRTVSVHCKGGKGRTGTMICCYLLYTGLKTTAEDALYHFARLRTKVGSSEFQGVQAPSQHRYVKYFEKLLTIPGQVISRRPLRIRKLKLHHIPSLWFFHDVGRLWFTIIEKPTSTRSVMFLSNEDVHFDSKVWDASTYTKKQFRDLIGSDEENLYKKCNVMDPTDSAEATMRLGYRVDSASFLMMDEATNGIALSHDEFYGKMKSSPTLPPHFAPTLDFRRCDELPPLDGDICIKFFFARNNPNPLEPPVQFWFHTAFISPLSLHLTRNEIDGPHKDTECKRYPSNFSIEVEFEECAS